MYRPEPGPLILLYARTLAALFAFRCRCRLQLDVELQLGEIPFQAAILAANALSMKRMCRTVRV